MRRKKPVAVTHTGRLSKAFDGSDWRIDHLIFHAVGFALDDDRFGLMEQAIQNSRRDARIVVEDRGPMFVRLVCREYNRPAFVPLANDLEE